MLSSIDTNDPDWSIVPLTIWSSIEVNISLVSVCLPTFAPLFKGWLPHLLSSLRSRSGRTSHSKIPPDEDQTRIYTGVDKKVGNGTETRIGARNQE